MVLEVMRRAGKTARWLGPVGGGIRGSALSSRALLGEEKLPLFVGSTRHAASSSRELRNVDAC